MGFRPRGVVHVPVGLALRVPGGFIADLAEVAPLHVRLMHLIHLLLDLVIAGVPLLGREQAILRIPQGRVWMVTREGRIDFVTQDFIEALRRRGEGFQVGIVERPRGRVGEDVQVGLAQHEVHRIGARAVGQGLPGKQHAIAGETPLESVQQAITTAVAEVGHNIGASILMEGVFEMGVLSPAHLHAQAGANLAQTAEFHDLRERPRQGIEDLVDDNGIEFVGEMPGRTIIRVVGHGPVEVEFPLGIGLGHMDGDRAAGGQVVHGEPREHGLGTQDADRHPCGGRGDTGKRGCQRWVHTLYPLEPGAIMPYTHRVVFVVFVRSSEKSTDGNPFKANELDCLLSPVGTRGRLP